MWPLLTGLAIGFLVGREVGTTRGSGGESAAVVGSKAGAGTKMPAKIYKAESEFPADWTKSADLATVASVSGSFADLTPAQKVTVMQAQGGGPWAVALRIPPWAASATATLNGVPVPVGSGRLGGLRVCRILLRHISSPHAASGVAKHQSNR